MKKLIVLLTTFSLLTGCSGVGVVTSSTQAIYDRYDLQHNLNNDEIGLQIDHTIASDPAFAQSHVEVSAFNYRILLVGTTSSEKLRRKAAKIAAYTHDVVHVYNFIRVAPQDDSSSVMNDGWITTKIRTKIISNAKVNPNQIKIVTDNGIVYLMGLLTPKEAKIAVDTARHTADVKEVFELFQYLEITEEPVG
jgi:osmotically-inducible protein OsmY